jgi:putative ABC transport system permease protein
MSRGDELSEEIQEHLREKTEELIAAGMSPEEARAAARRDFGNVGLVEERSREVWRWPLLENFVSDVRYGLRMLGRNPGFALVMALTLALGMGVNTAIFSVIESVLLRPLPYRHADRLFAVWAGSKEEGEDRAGVSAPEFQDYLDHAGSFESMTTVIPRFTYVLENQGEPRTVICTGVSFGFFPTLGVKPILGRLYAPEEYHVDGVQVVISEKFWKQQLGGDPQVIGRTLGFDGTAQTVIGVVPVLADLFPDTDVWAKNVPEFRWMQVRSNRFMDLVGRLKEGATPQQAEQELSAILRRGPGESPNSSVRLVPLKDEVTGEVRPQLVIVMAAAGLVLLIMCANITYLLLARSSKRQAEIAVRVSLGAGPGRILRQFVTENLLIALAGGGLGLLLAYNCVGLLARLNLGNLPRGHVIGVDPYALLFAFTISLVTSVLVGWAPATIFGRLDLHSTLKTGRSEAGSFGKSRFRMLLVSEVALAVVLLFSAGLLLRSFWEAEHVDPGFRRDGLLTAYLRTSDYQDARLFFPDLVERTSQLPGVQATAVANCLPAAGAWSATLTFNDRANDPYHVPEVAACWISPDFFPAIGTRLLSGRFFSARDNATGPPVVIINQAMAQAYWPGKDPIGKRIAADYVGSGRITDGTHRFRDVVGVVQNIKEKGLDLPVEPALYTPYLQDETNHAFAGMSLFMRSSGDPKLLAETVRKQVHMIRPLQPVERIRTMDDVLYQTLAPRRFSLILVGSFAALAMLLSGVGIFGMIAYSVSHRTREFGLRMALGARRGEVLALVMKDGMLLAAIGLGIGVLIAIGFARMMSSLLFNVTATDPLAFAGAIALLSVVAACACFFPAWRAMKVDPQVALRHN